MLDKVTEAGTQAVASRYVSPNAKGIEATPSNIRQMLVRCGHGATAANELQKLLDLPATPGPARTVAKPALSANPTGQVAADGDDERL
jgi:hypothetical protein